MLHLLLSNNISVCLSRIANQLQTGGHLHFATMIHGIYTVRLAIHTCQFMIALYCSCLTNAVHHCTSWWRIQFRDTVGTLNAKTLCCVLCGSMQLAGVRWKKFIFCCLWGYVVPTLRAIFICRKILDFGPPQCVMKRLQVLCHKEPKETSIYWWGRILLRSDLELSPIVNMTLALSMTLASHLKPHVTKLLPESETTKKLWNE